MKPRDPSTPRSAPAVGRTQPDVPARPVDVVIAVVLAGAALAGLLGLGASPAIARFALEATLAVVMVVWACDRRRSPTALLLPLAIFGLVWLQLVPLPDSLLVRMAPISGGAWKVAHEGVPGAWGRISIDPAATATAARRLLLGVGCFLVVRDIAASAGIRRWLAAALAFAAALIWGLGVAFPRDGHEELLLGIVDLSGPLFFWASSLLAPVETAGVANLGLVTVGRWRYPVTDGLVGDGFGSFISSNQFAGAMCLTLPLLLAAWLWIVRDRLPAWIGVVGAVVIGAAAAWTVGVRADSRAGGAAIVVGCIAFLALTARERWWRLTLAGVVGLTATVLAALAAAALGLMPGFVTLVPEHLRPTLARLLADNRSLGIRVGLRMVRASPVAGTGLDSYAEVFSRFQPGEGTMFYAHNDYVQWIAETGLIGGVLAAACGFFVVRRGSAWLQTRHGVERILAAGVAAAAIGFASHEVFEWNMHLPAIALVAAIVAGMAAPAACGAATTGSSFAWLRIPAAIAVVAAVVATTGFLFRDMMTERAAKHVRTALLADRIALQDPKRPPPPRADLEAAIAAAGAQAARWDPANADLPLLLGQAHLHLAARAAGAIDRDAQERAAAEWFTKARRRRAICFGLPEPVAPPAKPPVPVTASRPPGP
jgi:O-antigen ligase